MVMTHPSVLTSPQITEPSRNRRPCTVVRVTRACVIKGFIILRGSFTLWRPHAASEAVEAAASGDPLGIPMGLSCPCRQHVPPGQHPPMATGQERFPHSEAEGQAIVLQTSFMKAGTGLTLRLRAKGQPQSHTPTTQWATQHHNCSCSQGQLRQALSGTPISSLRGHWGTNLVSRMEPEVRTPSDKGGLCPCPCGVRGRGQTTHSTPFWEQAEMGLRAPQATRMTDHSGCPGF